MARLLRPLFRPLLVGLGSDGALPSGSTSSIALWTPLNLGAALVEWWSADDTANGAVSTWTSRKGLATTAAAGLEPISAAASFNSAYRGLTFDGVDDCLVTATLTSLPLGATAGEIWTSASNAQAGTGTGARAVCHYGGSSTNSRGLHRVGVTNVSRARATDGTATLTDTVGDWTGPHIVGAGWNGTTEFGRFDGRDMTPATAVISTLATTAARLRIGSASAVSASAFWWGGIRHVLITTLLTQSQRFRLEGFLAWDGGLQGLLPANHAYAAAAPTTAWNPWDLDTALSAWWAAEDHGTARMVDDGAGLISSWTDKVGSMALTAITTGRPTWAATSFNSAYQGLAFDGVLNALFSSTLTTLPTGSTGGWIFMVGSQAATGASARCAVGYGGSTAGTDRRLVRTLSTVSRFSPSDTATSLIDTIVTFDGNHIFSAAWAGTTLSGRLDGQATTPASTTIATLATGTTRMRIGATNAGSITQPYAGQFCQVLIGTTITTGQFEQLEGWAAWAFGLVPLLPVGHTYKSAPP